MLLWVTFYIVTLSKRFVITSKNLYADLAIHRPYFISSYLFTVISDLSTTFSTASCSETHLVNIYLFKFNNGNTRKEVIKMFKVNNTDTRTTSITSFWYLYYNLWPYFSHLLWCSYYWFWTGKYLLVRSQWYVRFVTTSDHKHTLWNFTVA